jgi:3-oxoadipate enol-lactonase
MPTVDIDGVIVYYEVMGEGDSVVLLPGLAADHTFWTGMVPTLASRHRVLTLDIRGAGRSDAPDRPYDMHVLARDVVAVFDASDVPNAHVIGHSMGAAVAQQLAREQPDIVRSLVLFNAFARLTTQARLALRAAGRFYATEPHPIEALATSLFPWLYSRRFLDSGNMLATLMQQSASYPYPQPRAGYERQLEALLAFDSTSWLGDIVAPTFVAAAEHDLLTPPDAVAALASRLAHASLVTIPGAGHCAPVEQPALCAALVLGFLEVSRTAAG